MEISHQRRDEIIDALRRGTVPSNGLDSFAVGLDSLKSTIDDELRKVKKGQSQFKAIRGDYGCGKTFFSRWICDRARRMAFATAEVQISESETPLHRLETVYRRMTERLATSDTPRGAMRNIVDGWFYALEGDVLDEGNIDESDQNALLKRTNELLETRLQKVTETAPMFSQALRAYRRAQAENDQATADGILSWLSGQPNVAAVFKRYAGVKGDIDHFGALTCLQGLLTVLRDSGSAGIVVVLDEVETIQRVRSDVRDKGLNALRQLIDEVDSGRFPGLYLVITGTPAFFDGPNGVARLEPLAQRLHVDFQADTEFDNPRAVQIRLPAFDLQRLQLVGCKVRDIFCEHNDHADRIRDRCSNDYVERLADSVAGKLGGKVGVAPRIFLKKLVDVLDKVELNDKFEPTKHYSLTIADRELSDVERQTRPATSVDDIEFEL